MNQATPAWLPRPTVWNASSVILFGLLAALLTVTGAAFLPYSAAGVLGVAFGLCLLAARPDVAFALFFAAETLFSEDILLITEKLALTIYRVELPLIHLNVFEVGLLVLVGATLLQRAGKIYGTRLDFTMALFGLACLIGYITCIRLYGDPARIFEPRRLLHFFVSYYLAVNLIRDKKSLQTFLTVYFIAVVLKAIEGVFLYSIGSGLQIKWKMFAIFTEWGDSLNFLTFMLFLSAFVLDKTDMPGRRWFLLAMPAVLFSFLFSYKRAYYVALITGGAVLFLLQGRQARIRFIALLLGGAVLMMGVITLAGQWESLGSRAQSILQPTKESSAYYRIIEWRNAFISIEKHPWLGIGLGGVMPMVIYMPRTNLLGVHNTYIWTAVKMGVPGLLAYLFIKLAFLRQLVRQNSRLKDPYLRAVSRALTCAFIGFCTAEMFAPMFAQMRTATWLGIMLGIGMTLGQIDLDERKTTAEK